MEIKPTVSYHLSPFRMVVIKKNRDNVLITTWEKGTLVPCWWEWTLEQPLLYFFFFLEVNKLTIEYIILIQKSHIWIYKGNYRNIEKISALPCLLQCYSHKPRHGNNLNVLQWMTCKEEVVCLFKLHTMEYYSTTRKRKSCYLCPLGWLRKAL